MNVVGAQLAAPRHRLVPDLLSSPHAYNGFTLQLATGAGAGAGCPEHEPGMLFLYLLVSCQLRNMGVLGKRETTIPLHSVHASAKICMPSSDTGGPGALLGCSLEWGLEESSSCEFTFQAHHLGPAAVHDAATLVAALCCGTSGMHVIDTPASAAQVQQLGTVKMTCTVDQCL